MLSTIGQQDQTMRNLANSVLEVSIAKGRAEGRVEGLRAALRKLMQLKFGGGCVSV